MRSPDYRLPRVQCWFLRQTVPISRLERQLCIIENAGTQNHVAVGVPVVVVGYLPVDTEPCLLPATPVILLPGQRVADYAAGIAIEHVGAPYVFIAEPLQVRYGSLARILHGSLNLYDMHKFMGNHNLRRNQLWEPLSGESSERQPYFNFIVEEEGCLRFA